MPLARGDGLGVSTAFRREDDEAWKILAFVSEAVQ